MLHITNGDAAAAPLRAAGLPGEIAIWRDVLHEGPVPADMSRAEMRTLRANFIAQSGWGAYEEAMRTLFERDRVIEENRHAHFTLWFEADLYDQLQLIAALTMLADLAVPPERIAIFSLGSFSNIHRFVGLSQLAPVDFATLYADREPLDAAGLTVAREAWDAFRAPEPAALAGIAAQATSGLPHLADAFARLMREYPARANGLSETQTHALVAIAKGLTRAGAVYGRVSDEELRPFLGDTVFWSLIDALVHCAHPPLAFVEPPNGSSFAQRELALTDYGARVLAGDADLMAGNSIDRWIGGVHLRSGDRDWRYDARTNAVIEN